MRLQQSLKDFRICNDKEPTAIHLSMNILNETRKQDKYWLLDIGLKTHSGIPYFIVSHVTEHLKIY